MTVLLSSILMLTVSGATQSVQAQLFSPNQAVALDFYILEDESGSISDADYVLDINGKKAGLQALFDAIPELFGKIRITVIGFGDTAHLRCQVEIVDQAALTALIDCLSNLIGDEADPADDIKDDGLTRIDLALAMVEVEIGNAPSQFAGDDDHQQVIDIVTDGDPTDPNDDVFGDGSEDPFQNTIDARNSAINNAGVDKIASLAVGSAPNIPFLRDDVVFPQPGVVDPSPIPQNVGFVITAPSFDEFEEAFESKLFGDICDFVPSDDPRCAPPKVGGEFLPVDSTALLIAGMSANMSLIAPLVLGIAGASAYLIRSRMNKD